MLLVGSSNEGVFCPLMSQFAYVFISGHGAPAPAPAGAGAGAGVPEAEAEEFPPAAAPTAVQLMERPAHDALPVPGSTSRAIIVKVAKGTGTNVN